MPKGIKGFQKGHPQFNTGRTHFKKKITPWNKELKGIHLCPKNEFKKGHPAPKTAFKKGHVPYNKLHPECMKRSKEHPNYKGGKIIGSKGYIFILNPSHPRTNYSGYVKRANLIMEKTIGRYLKRGEVVHHKGIKYHIHSIENRQDDRPENLMLFTNDIEHRKFHNLSKAPIYK